MSFLHFQLLFQNHWVNLNQTVLISLGGSEFKFVQIKENINLQREIIAKELLGKRSLIPHKIFLTQNKIKLVKIMVPGG
jgi:hypothetical protein